jgi:hypothetical protein
MPLYKTYEIHTEVITYIKANDKEIANFSATGRSSGNSVDGLAKAAAPALADALAVSSRMLTVVEEGQK